MCVVLVCAVCGCVFCLVGVPFVCVVVVCRTHSQDHGKHILIDVHVGVIFLLISHEKKKRSLEHLLFHDVCFFEAFDFPMVSCFLLLVAVSSTFRDFKPYLFYERGVARALVLNHFNIRSRCGYHYESHSYSCRVSAFV